MSPRTKLAAATRGNSAAIDAAVKSALAKMGFEATATRGRDRLDFADIHVETAAAAVRAAIEAFMEARSAQGPA